MHVTKMVIRQSILIVLHTSTPVLHHLPPLKGIPVQFIVIIIMYLQYNTTWKWPSEFRILLHWTLYSPKHISLHKEAAHCSQTVHQLSKYPTSYSTTLSRFWRIKHLTNIFPVLLCKVCYILSWELQQSY